MTLRVLCVDEESADTVTESCVGRFFMMDYRRKQHRFPSEGMKFGSGLLVF